MKYQFIRRLPIGSTVFLLSLVLLLPSVNAQLLGGSGKSASTKLVPASSVASAALFPKQIAKDPDLDLIPREIISAWGLKEIGLDPMLLNEVTFVVRKLDGFGQPPAWAAVMRLDDTQALAGNLIDQLEEKTIGGKKVFSGTSIGKPSFMVFDESTIVAGDEQFFVDLVDANGKGPVIEIMKGSRLNGQFQSFVDVKTMRPLIVEAMSNLPPLPPQLARLRVIPKKVDSIELGLNVGSGLRTTIVMNTDNAEDAEEVSEILTDGIQFGTEMGINMLAAQFNPDDPVQEAWLDYIDRIASIYQDNWTPVVSGSQLTIQLDEETSVLPFLFGMGLPAVQQTRAAARRTQSMNNARQMTLAVHNFESANGKFPMQATKDDRGEPLLSWRVQILPFIEQQELYDQFHHDEPWDSPHNKKLIKKMPLVFQSPSAATRPGETVYQGISGPGTVFDGEAKNFGSLTDGSSNTAMFVEVNEDRAVPWTKPADYEFDEANPMDGIGRLQPGTFIVSFADGSVHNLSSGIDPKVWRLLQTIADGEPIDYNDF